MSTIKNTMKEIIDGQPDDSSFDEILRELAFAAMIQRGLEDVEQKRTVSNEEMKKRIDQWQ
jgi:hypothetical protein